jgi:hypothetical protein
VQADHAKKRDPPAKRRLPSLPCRSRANPHHPSSDGASRHFQPVHFCPQKVWKSCA